MVVLAVAAASLAVMVAPAGAVKHLPLQTFGDVAQPTFGHAEAMAVDPSTGNVLVVDAEAGTISRYNPDGTPADFAALGTNVIDGSGVADGTPQGDLSFGTAPFVELAVDRSGGTTDGNIYVTEVDRQLVDVFANDGAYLGQLTGPGGDAFVEPAGVAVDSAGALYVGDRSTGMIDKFVPSGSVPSNFDNTAKFTGVSRPGALAVGVGPTADSLFVLSRELQAPVLELSTTTGGRQGEVAEGFEGVYRTLAVDPASGHVYVTKADTVEEYAAGATSRFVSSTHSASQVEGVAVDGASGRLYLSREESAEVEVSPPGPLIPQVENQRTANADFTEATLRADINPEGSETNYYVEYGADSSYGSSTTPKSAGSSKADRPVSFSLTGLTPGTAYHWRVVATNSIGTTEGDDMTLATHHLPTPDESCPNQPFRVGPSAPLPDCRAYELVSPVDKNGSDIYAPLDLDTIPLMLNQAAVSGEMLTFTSSQGFGDPVGVPLTSQYIASRGAQGWSSQSLSPPQGIGSADGLTALNNLEFRAFTPDLCHSALVNTNSTPLVSGAVEGYWNIYSRQNCGEEGYTAVTTVKPPSASPRGLFPVHLVVQGQTPDGRCVVFRARDKLTANANPGFPGFGSNLQLYESCGSGLRLVSVLPNGSASEEDGSVGTANDVDGVKFRHNTLARAVSVDGSRIYWSQSSSLYLRINADEPQSAFSSSGECTEPDKGCTIPVSESGTAHFWSASPDGSKALYTDGLLGDGGAEGQLYEYDLPGRTSAPIASEVSGVIGASEDASRVYFTSKEVLTSGANAQGAAPSAGSSNLYLFDSGRTGVDRYRFIGTLSKIDSALVTAGGNGGDVVSPVNLFPYRKTSRVTPDGQGVAFMSTARLTGYDNADADNGKADAEVYSYEADANGGEGQLRCVSCNPAGQRPRGRNLMLQGNPTRLWAAALLSPYYTDLYGPRVISDNGRRVFFNSYDALVPADTNGKADVYQWEAPGSGTCSVESSHYSSMNEGCVSLISTGDSPSDSEFIDAGPDGRDVFFTTRSSLVPQDPDLIDIYDARVGGGFPLPPTQPAACEGEACQNPPPAPGDPAPSTSSFSGTGNVKPRHKNKHHKKRHQKKSKKQKHRANDNRRTAR